MGFHDVIPSPRQSNPRIGTNAPESSAVIAPRVTPLTLTNDTVHCFLQSGKRIAKLASPREPSTSATSSAHMNTPLFDSSLCASFTSKQYWMFSGNGMLSTFSSSALTYSTRSTIEACAGRGLGPSARRARGEVRTGP